MARQIPVQARQDFTMRAPRDPAINTTAHLAKPKDFKPDLNALQAAREWQPEAYLYSRIIGQVGFVHHITANTVAMCTLRPLKVDPWTNEEIVPEDGDAGYQMELAAVLNVMAAFVGPIGGQKELLRRAALNLRIGAETWLLATPSVDASTTPAGDSPELVWEFLSPIELHPDNTTGKLVRDRNGRVSQRERIGEDCYTARFWISDAEYADQPDCAMRRAIPDCRQYVKLRQVIDGSADSRIPAGILKVPHGLSFGPVEDHGADDEGDDDLDPFTEKLLDHMSTAKNNPGDPASYVPLTVSGEKDELEAMKMLSLGDEANAAWASALRSETLESIGQVLDAPAETIPGKGGLNHWTGYSIDAEFNSKHVIPLGQDITAFIVGSYMRFMLIEFEGFTEEQAMAWTLAFDASNITARADKGVTAMRLHDRELISDAAARDSNGFDESAAPSEEELRTRRLMKFIERNVAQLAPLIPLIPGFEQVDVSLIQPAAGGGSTGTGVEQPGAPPLAGDGLGPMDPESGGGMPPPPDGSGTPAQAAMFGDQAIVERLLGAADQAIGRALERAGARAISRAKGDTKAKFAALETTAVFGAIGPADDLGVPPEMLLDGAWDGFAASVHDWLRPWVVVKIGRNGSTATETTNAVLNELCAMLQTITLDDRGRRTYDDGTRLPRSVVVDALELAGPVRW